mmetsp:Transcript_39964/g.129397  ORF Transcript_39964/g.129397 Transcript_39964/m.129397 type:complete len:222 (+) Transcript_39964:1086-1751(+)
MWGDAGRCGEMWRDAAMEGGAGQGAYAEECGLMAAAAVVVVLARPPQLSPDLAASRWCVSGCIPNYQCARVLISAHSLAPFCPRVAAAFRSTIRLLGYLELGRREELPLARRGKALLRHVWQQIVERRLACQLDADGGGARPRRLLRLHFAGGGGGDGGDGGRGEDELELRLDLGELCCEEVEQHDLRHHERLWPARAQVHSSGGASGACLARAGDMPSTL